MAGVDDLMAELATSQGYTEADDKRDDGAGSRVFGDSPNGAVVTNKTGRVDDGAGASVHQPTSKLSSSSSTTSGSAGASGSSSGSGSKRRRRRYRLLPEVDGYPSTTRICPERGWNTSAVWNPYIRSNTDEYLESTTTSDDGGAAGRGGGGGGGGGRSQAHTPPNNNDPQVEVIRRRSYERFKRMFKSLFREWCQDPRVAKFRLGSTLPVQTILERWHCMVKLDEHSRLRQLRRCAGGHSPPPSITAAADGRGSDSTSNSPSPPCEHNGSAAFAVDHRITDPILVLSQDRRRKWFGGDDESFFAAEDLLRHELHFQIHKMNLHVESKNGGAGGQKRGGSGTTNDRRPPLGSPRETTPGKIHVKRNALSSFGKNVVSLATDIERSFLRDVIRAREESDAQHQHDSSWSGGMRRKKKRKRGSHHNHSVTVIDEDVVGGIEGNDAGPTTDVVGVSCSGLTLQINRAHYVKMQILFDRFNTDSPTAEDHVARFRASLFSVLARYDMLEGAGLQSSLTGNVFDCLLEGFDCRAECFASPFNCRYERYCSAFPDTDRAFGSWGSFFDFCPTRGGSFQVNPPFVPGMLEQTAKHIETLLKASENDATDGSDHGADDDEDANARPTDNTTSSPPLMFIVFIPAWTETAGWKMFHDIKCHQRTHVPISQKDHTYCEGTQYRRKTRYRLASFDTSVFFLQNRGAASKWPVTDDKIERLRLAFASCNDAEDVNRPNSSETSTSGDRQPMEQNMSTNHPPDSQSGGSMMDNAVQSTNGNEVKRSVGPSPSSDQSVEVHAKKNSARTRTKNANTTGSTPRPARSAKDAKIGGASKKAGKELTSKGGGKSSGLVSNEVLAAKTEETVRMMDIFNGIARSCPADSNSTVVDSAAVDHIMNERRRKGKDGEESNGRRDRRKRGGKSRHTKKQKQKR